MRFEALQEYHWPWVVENIKCTRMADSKGIVAIDGESIAGAIVMDTWTHTMCMAHICVLDPKAWKAGLLQEAYEYVFGFCGRKFVLGCVLSVTPDILTFLRSLGWVIEYTLVDGYDEGIDLVYPKFTREQWLQRKAA